MSKIIALLIFFLAIGATNQKSEIVINAKLIRSFDSIDSQKQKHKFYDISLSIKNKSDKPVAFWLMTCSWDENFLINNDYIYFDSWGCDSNCPWIFHINPNDSLIRKATFYQIIETRFPYIKSTKFGLIYIDSIKCRNSSDYDQIMGDKSKQDKIIWSNALYLKKQ
jgi:hypothetical protein